MRVTLYGELVRRCENEVLFSVASNLGDARVFGIRGQVPIDYYLQCREGLDAIVCSVALAQLQGQSCSCR